MLQKILCRTRLTSFLQQGVIARTTSYKTNHFPLMQEMLTIVEFVVHVRHIRTCLSRYHLMLQYSREKIICIFKNARYPDYLKAHNTLL